MIKEKKIESQAKSSVKLSITVGAAETTKAYNDLLKEYSQKAQIKGFRPGKVPTSVLETKFGEGLKEEAGQKLAQDALREALETIEDKPLPFAHPSLEPGYTFKPGEEFSFAITYDVYPKITLAPVKALTITEPQVNIGKEDIQTELDKYQDQNAIVTDIKDGKAALNDIVTLDFVELNADGSENTETARADYVCTLGKKEGLYQFDEELRGYSLNEEVTISKTYPSDFEHSDLAGRDIKLKVKITRIRRKDLPKIDDDLAQDIDAKFKTLDDLKKDIKERLEKQVETRIRNHKIDQVLNQLIEANSFEVPDSMVLSQTYNQYERMVRNFGGKESTLLQILQAQGKTPQDLIEDWKPAAEKSIKTQVLVEALIKKESLIASEDELEAEYGRIAQESNSSVEDTKKYYVENNSVDYVRQGIVERKLFDKIISESTVKKGEKISFVDLASKIS